MNIIKVNAVATSELQNPEIFSIPIPEGSPFLVDRDSGKIIEPVLHFTLASQSMNTSNARCEDLKDWFTYLDEFEIEWLDAGEDELAQYQTIMQQTISVRHESYSIKTIRRRTATIVAFYRYWEGKGLYKGSVERQAKSGFYRAIDSNPLAHLGNSRQTRSSAYDSIGSNSDGPVKAMTPRVWQGVSRKLGNMQNTHRLIWEVALQTGMRIHEVLNLTKYEIQGLVSDPDAPAVLQPLVILGKGNVKRKAFFPNWLIAELNEYVRLLRSRAVKRKGGREPAALFLNTENPAHRGNPITQRTALRHFNAAVRAAGYVVIVEKTDPETGEIYYIQQAKYSGHSTRHSFAIWTYYARKSSGDSEPWKYIQSRLGHKHLQTTLDTYLRAADDFEAEVSNRILVDFREIVSGDFENGE